MSDAASQIPSHVPPELVMDFPLTTRQLSYSHPHRDIVPEIHKGPAIFYAPNAHPIPPQGAWVIRRHEDLKMAYENTEAFIKKGNTGFSALMNDTWDVLPSELDPPRHTGFRRALEPVFSPRSMAKLVDKVNTRAEDILATFQDRGHVEFVNEFAVPFPVSIVLDLLGLPQERMDEFMAWEYDLIHTNNIDDKRNTLIALKAFLMEEIEKRRINPTDDLISNTLQLEVDGRKWTTTEVFGHCFNLFIGGLDTVTANLGHQFHHLATHPEHQEYLRNNPDQVESAVMEMMRAYGAVTTMRICNKEIEIQGVTIKPGDRVAMSTPLGSNDPEVYEAPTEVRLDRRPVHLSFGWGIHRCIGAHLARRELIVAIQTLLKTLPQFRLAPDFKVPFLMSNVIHIQELQLVW